jgi:hypothetical protein
MTIFIVCDIVEFAESGDLKNLATVADVGNSETPADQAGPSKQFAYGVWGGVSCYIEIFWLDTQHQIAYAATDKVGLETGVFQLINQMQSIGIYTISRDLMFV